MKVDQLVNLIYSDYKLDPEGAIKELKHGRKTYFWLSVLFLVGFISSLFLLVVFIGHPFNMAIVVVVMFNLSAFIGYVSNLFKIVKAIKIIQSLIDNRGGKR